MKLVILSGGLDSVVLLHWVLANSESNADVDTIIFDYGQKHKKELVYAKYWTQLFNLGSMVYDLNGMFHDSALLGDRAMPYNDEDMSPTVVPGRNMVFISVAASRAMADGYKKAFVAQDGYEGYPDGTECLFIGGTNDFKDTQESFDAVVDAKKAGLFVHVGRVTGVKRFMFYEDAGADTCDGSGLTRFDATFLSLRDRYKKQKNQHVLL